METKWECSFTLIIIISQILVIFTTKTEPSHRTNHCSVPSWITNCTFKRSNVNLIYSSTNIRIVPRQPVSRNWDGNRKYWGWWGTRIWGKNLIVDSPMKERKSCVRKKSTHRLEIDVVLHHTGTNSMGKVCDDFWTNFYLICQQHSYSAYTCHLHRIRSSDWNIKKILWISTATLAYEVIDWKFAAHYTRERLCTADSLA